MMEREHGVYGKRAKVPRGGGGWCKIVFMGKLLLEC